MAFSPSNQHSFGYAIVFNAPLPPRLTPPFVSEEPPSWSQLLAQPQPDCSSPLRARSGRLPSVPRFLVRTRTRAFWPSTPGQRCATLLPRSLPVQITWHHRSWHQSAHVRKRPYPKGLDVDSPESQSIP